MIKEVSLSNFKAFSYEQVVKLAPITLVFGKNSSGKTSLIQSILLLAQSISPTKERVTLETRGSSVDLGSFESLIHRHNKRTPLDLGITFTPRQSDILRHGGSSLNSQYAVSTRFESGPDDDAELTSVRYCAVRGEQFLDVQLKIAREQRDIWNNDSPLYRWSNDSDADSFLRYTRSESRSTAPISPEVINRIEAAVRSAQFLPWAGLPSRMGLIREAIPRTSERLLVSGLYRQFQAIESIASAFSNSLRGISYLGPLRTHPARHYVTQGGKLLSVGKTGEYTPHILYKNHFMQDHVNRWFGLFEIPYRLAVQSVGNAITGDLIAMSLMDSRTGITVAPSDVGFGIGQLLPVLVEGLLNESKTILVEQPEIHLHPKLQANLADFFIETSRVPHGDGRQWIVETHSEALMLRMLRRIRDGSIDSRQVAVIYVESTEDGAKITPLRISSDGEFLDEWPGGFFEESFLELTS